MTMNAQKESKGQKELKAREELKAEAEAQRLLRALSSEGAWGFDEMVDGKARIGVAARKNNVSLRVATGSLAAAARLCSDDLAQWQAAARDDTQRRLELTAAGRAHLARAQAREGVDPFFAQHKPFVRKPADETPDAVDVLHDQAESPIAWLATRKGRDGRPMIDVCALQAGERLRRDLTLAQILPRVTANWSSEIAGRGRGAGAENISEMTISARQRVTLALTAVGPDFSGLLIDICGFTKGLELIETERGWPQRSAKVVLVLALNQLCRHYGITTYAVGPKRSSGVRHWGVEDFRPNLSGVG